MADSYIKVTCADGQPLSVLNDIVQRRKAVLKETTHDASVAVLITAMKSVRAATSKAKKTATVTETPAQLLSISVTRCPALKTGIRYVGGAKKLVVLEGDTIRHDIRPWIQAAPGTMLGANVYRIVLSGDRVKAWPHQKVESYMIAVSDASAKQIVKNRYTKIISRYSGLGRSVLTRAMMMTSTKFNGNFTIDQKGMSVVNRGGMVVHSDKTTGGDSGRVDIHVEDNLDYASDALKGGEGAVNQALMRAANSINGYVNAYIDKHALYYFENRGDAFWQQHDAPFPPECFTEETMA